MLLLDDMNMILKPSLFISLYHIFRIKSHEKLNLIDNIL